MAKGKQGSEKGFFMAKNWDSMLDADHFEAALNDKDFSVKRLVRLQDLEGSKHDAVDQLLLHLVDFLALTDPGKVSLNDNDRASADALFNNLDTALNQVNTLAADQKSVQSAIRYVEEVIRSRLELLRKQPTEPLSLKWYNAHMEPRGTYKHS